MNHKSAIIPPQKSERTGNIKVDAEQKEAPLNVLQQEIGQIVFLQQNLNIQSDLLKEETKKLNDLLELSTRFSQGTVEERQKLLENQSVNSFDDIFSGLVNSAQSKIENTVFLLLLAAVEINSQHLAFVMEKNNLKNQQHFDTFNPMSFGPGIGQDPFYDQSNLNPQTSQSSIDAEIVALTDLSAKNGEEINKLQQSLIEAQQAENDLKQQEETLAKSLKSQDDEIKKYQEEIEALNKELLALEQEKSQPVDAC